MQAVGPKTGRRTALAAAQAELGKLTNAQLQHMLGEAGLPTAGKKAELVSRLETADALDELTKAQLQQRLSEAGLPTGGSKAKKAELIASAMAAGLQPEGEEAEEEEEAVAVGREEEQEEAASQQCLTKLTVAQLQQRLREAGLPAGGKKADLVARLEPTIVRQDPVKMTVAQLQQRLKDAGLPSRGKKAELIARLRGAFPFLFATIQESTPRPAARQNEAQEELKAFLMR